MSNSSNRLWWLELIRPHSNLSSVDRRLGRCGVRWNTPSDQVSGEPSRERVGRRRDNDDDIAPAAVGYLGIAVTNGAVDFLVRSLALELGPICVNAVSPGVIDTGSWDALGEEGKRDYFADLTERNPARRIGTVDDIADAVLFAMTSTFLTGVTLRVDGGEPLI